MSNETDETLRAQLANERAIADAIVEQRDEALAQLATVTAERDKLRATLEDNAAVDALNAIAALCGCPEWDYPGQLVRDVEALRAEVARARAEGRATGLREALAMAREVESEHSDSLLCSDLTYGKAYGAGIVAGCIEEMIAKGGGV